MDPKPETVEAPVAEAPAAAAPAVEQPVADATPAPEAAPAPAAPAAVEAQLTPEQTEAAFELADGNPVIAGVLLLVTALSGIFGRKLWKRRKQARQPKRED